MMVEMNKLINFLLKVEDDSYKEELRQMVVMFPTFLLPNFTPLSDSLFVVLCHHNIIFLI